MKVVHAYRPLELYGSILRLYEKDKPQVEIPGSFLRPSSQLAPSKTEHFTRVRYNSARHRKARYFFSFALNSSTGCCKIHACMYRIELAIEQLDPVILASWFHHAAGKPL